jgi:hypothetical protein
MNYDQFKMLLRAHAHKPKRQKRQVIANSGAARLQNMGGLHPYDSYRQRDRYAKQEARRMHKLASMQDEDER